MKAIKNKLIVKKDIFPEKIGNIYIPKKDGVHGPPYSGIIKSVGETVKDKDLKIGQRILFHDLAGVEIYYNNELLIILREDEVTAIIDKNLEIF